MPHIYSTKFTRCCFDDPERIWRKVRSYETHNCEIFNILLLRLLCSSNYPFSLTPPVHSHPVYYETKNSIRTQLEQVNVHYTVQFISLVPVCETD